jgi:hypothetical protein
LLIALAVLALSATAALAGRSVLSTPQDQVVSQHEQGDEQAEESEAPDTDTGEAAEGDADESGAPDAPAADESATTDTTTGEHPDNHGKLVSEAAQGATPAGFANHGAYVKTIAQDNHGHATAAKHAAKP